MDSFFPRLASECSLRSAGHDVGVDEVVNVELSCHRLCVSPFSSGNANDVLVEFIKVLSGDPAFRVVIAAYLLDLVAIHGPFGR